MLVKSILSLPNSFLIEKKVFICKDFMEFKHFKHKAGMIFRYCKENLPQITIWLIVVIILIVNFNIKNWNKPRRVIINDVVSYYAYLPATFIHKDLSFSFVKNDVEKYKHRFYLFDTPTGKKTIITSMGQSILYAPFFFMAHLMSPILGFDADGFTTPYKFALIMSCIVYLMIGLYYLKRFLLLYYNKYIVSLTILSVVVGTNLFYYSTIEAAMPHAYIFSLICIFIYYVDKWHENPNYKYTIILGFLSGLITLIRPTNIIILLFLIFWGITSWKAMINRIIFFTKSYRLVFLMILSFLIVWIPQFIYWYYVSGKIFYYTYQEHGGRFFFDNPQVINQLFSYRKGWFVYTPIMAFATIGIPILLRKYKQLFLPVLIFLIVTVYVLSSWWSWWFGGSFGLRTYVEFYGIMAIPLAAFISWGIQRQVILKLSSILIIALLISFNLFQIKQYYYGVIHYDSMTKKAYWAVFLKKHRPHDFYQLIEKPNYQKAKEEGIYTTIPGYYSKE